MDKVDILERKIRQVAEQLISLRENNRKLEAELSFLQGEQKRAQHAINENENLKTERKTVTGRIEKLLKKLTAASTH